MSKTVILPIGQDDIIQAQPLVQIPEQVIGGLHAFWQKAREECEERFSPAQCQALLGLRPTILAPPEEGIKWYVWLGIGVLVGKVIL